MIKVSVIVPVYKVPLKYLRACLDSLAAQTLQECEFIIVSDGAPEPECSICETYATKDKRFKFFKREHAGVSATRNYGINQSQGEYITFIDCDDWIEKEMCVVSYKYAKKNNADLVLWDLNAEKEQKTIFSTKLFSTTKSLLDINEILTLRENTIYAPKDENLTPVLPTCKLLKRELINKFTIRFDENLSYGEDRVFNLSFTSKVSRISYLKRVLYHYRLHPSSATNSYQKDPFHRNLLYIKKLKELSKTNFSKAISNEALNSYFSCLVKIYHSGLTSKEIYNEIKKIKKEVNTSFFASIIQHASFPRNSFYPRHNLLEFTLMKRKIFIFLNYRLIKAKIASFIQ